MVTGVQFQINGSTVSWSDTHTTPVQPGESVTLTANWGPNNKATWTAANGTFTVTAWVDDVDRIAESMKVTISSKKFNHRDYSYTHSDTNR